MKMTSYPEGTPSWVDLGTADPDAAVAFYGGLFGWTADEGSPEFGGYRMAMYKGTPVAGIAPLMSPDQPSMWSSYFASDNVDATAAKVEAAGGKAIMAPMDVGDIGRMGVFLDSEGSFFGAWQKGTFAGAGLATEPNTLVWNELRTRNMDGAKQFYAGALGIGAKVSDVSGEVPYTEFTVGGRTIAGGMAMDDEMFPPDLPSHWMVFFGAADVDATTAKVAGLGGKVVVAPMDIPVGRFSIASDPGGATFAIITMSEWPTS
jgi:predicted enzyme related to lactoylglutathione lyase